MTQHFTPKPGQVDYTNIRYAPTVNIVVTYGIGVDFSTERRQ